MPNVLRPDWAMSMMAVPVFALLGWGGVLLPMTTGLHQVAWLLLTCALGTLMLVIIGSHMCRVCRVVALPAPALVVLPAVVIVPVLTDLAVLARVPLRPLLDLLPAARRRMVYPCRYAPDDPVTSEAPSDTVAR